MGIEIPGYRIIERIGHGAVAEVFKAERLALNQKVALKVLKKKWRNQKGYARAFIHEARSAAKITDPRIVTIYDVGVAENVPYIAMEFVEGNSTGRYLIDHGPFSETSLLEVGRDVCAALAALERHGLVHRDVKPDNILLTAESRYKLCDLGIATSLQAQSSSTLRIPCTPYFASPEQALGLALDIRSDLYSLGASLFALATSKPPFRGQTIAEQLQAHVNLPPPSLRQHRPDLSNGIEVVVTQLLAKDPDQRPPTAQAAHQMFARLLQGQPLAIKRSRSGRKDVRKRYSSRTLLLVSLGLSIPLLVALRIVRDLLLAY